MILLVGAVGFVSCNFNNPGSVGIAISQNDITDTSAVSGDKKTGDQDKVAKEQSGRKKLKVKIPTRIKASEIDNYPVAKTCIATKPPFIVAQVSCMRGNDLAGSYISVSLLRGPPQIV